MSTPVDTSRDAYAERVRAALADLPAAERDDLVAELDDHLAEVAAELPEAGGTLAERLGPPEAYAAELRAAAGLPPAPSPVHAARSGPDLWAGPRAVARFLPELRPGWWVLRGLIFAAAPALLLPAGVLLTLLLSLVTVPLSVLLGRRGAAGGLERWAGVAASVAAMIAVLFVLPAAARAVSGYTAVEYAPPPPSAPLDGVTNIHPYSSDGKPLTDVLLYDQDGNPLVLGDRVTQDGNPITSVPRYSTSGQVLDNVYPQEQTMEDYSVLVVPDTGQPRHRVPAPRVTPPALQPR